MGVRALSWTAPLIGAFLCTVWALSPGCGPFASSPDDDAVVLWHSMPQDFKAVLETLVTKFNRGRTRHKVVLRYQGEYGSLKSKISMAIKAGSPPDMAQLHEAWISYFNSEQGHEVLLPLNDLVSRDEKEVQLSDFYEAFIQDNLFDGKLYALPFNKSFLGLFYNKELFERAGLDPEKPPKTWEEFRLYGRKLTGNVDRDGVRRTWGWAFHVDPWLFECMTLQRGGLLTKGDSLLAPLNSPEMLQVVDFFLDAINGPFRYAYRTNGRDFQNDFVGQRVAMIVTSCVAKAFMIDQIGFRWGLAPIPQGPKKVSIMSGTNIGLFARSSPEKRAVAWEFVKFFTARENTVFWAIKTGYVPVRKSAVRSKEFQDYLKIDPTPLAAVAQLECATYEPRVACWFDVRDKLTQALLRSLLGQGTPKENLDWATAEAAKAQCRKAPQS